MLFGKKKPETAVAAPENQGEVEAVTQSLYKQNLELANRNKTLSVLGKLYEISIQTFTPQELAQKITSIIQVDFEYERVGILDYDAATDSMRALAFTESNRFNKARQIAKEFFENVQLTDASKNPFFGKMLETKQMAHTEDLDHVWGWGIDKEKIEKITSEGHAKSVLAYPLIMSNEVKGFFVITLNRIYEDLVEYEKESIRSFINVISVALDKAHLYEELTVSNHKLEDANRQQVVLIHFITHQIKGFVTKSRNIFSMLIEGDYGALPEAMKPMIEEGFRSDTQGATTIQEILNASNIKSGAVTYTMAPFDFGALVTEVAEGLQPTAEAKKLAFVVDTKGGPYTISGDRMQLQNAVKNIIDNSIKYTPSGSVKIVLKKAGNMLRFEQQDTGIGITPEDMAKLFTEGGHGADSIKVNVESTGFGLYIVKNIINAHHGRVWAESAGAGKGSKFIIELPLTQPAS